MPKFKRVHLVVMDSVGIGAAPDSDKFFNAGVADTESDTLGHISEKAGLDVPNMAKIGLGNIPRDTALATVPAESHPTGYVTKLEEVSLGKDTMTGHWEIMGLNITEPFDTFWDGFPEEILTKIEEFSGRKIIREANKPYSGTAVIDDFGPRQMETGELIVYTSADPVLQIAAHEDIIPLDELYRICEYARSITLERPALLGRIIARPYVGEPGNFSRTANRHDYAVSPFEATVLNKLADAGLPTYSVGKISDIFNGSGITNDMGHTKSNMHGVDVLIETLKLPEFEKGFSFTNLVDFDMLYGHRNDPAGYKAALEEVDGRLPEILETLTDEDVLIISADHGCDPTTESTDHSREYIPLLVYGKSVEPHDMGIRASFTDIGKSILAYLDIENTLPGKSFL